MKRLVLIDTCAFVEYLRDGKNEVVPTLVAHGSSILSKVVRLELLKGVRRSDRTTLTRLFEGVTQIPDFPSPEQVEKNLFTLHGRGLNLGIADLLILSDALRCRAALLTTDLAMKAAQEEKTEIRQLTPTEQALIKRLQGNAQKLFLKYKKKFQFAKGPLTNNRTPNLSGNQPKFMKDKP